MATTVQQKSSEESSIKSKVISEDSNSVQCLVHVKVGDIDAGLIVNFDKTELKPTINASSLKELQLRIINEVLHPQLDAYGQTITINGRRQKKLTDLFRVPKK